MALHIVVHHRRDRSQPWANDWQDDQRLKTITTTAEIGRFCENAKGKNARVFVHRCAWSSKAPTICCWTKPLRGGKKSHNRV